MRPAKFKPSPENKDDRKDASVTANEDRALPNPLSKAAPVNVRVASSKTSDEARTLSTEVSPPRNDRSSTARQTDSASSYKGPLCSNSKGGRSTPLQALSEDLKEDTSGAKSLSVNKGARELLSGAKSLSMNKEARELLLGANVQAPLQSATLQTVSAAPEELRKTTQTASAPVQQPRATTQTASSLLQQPSATLQTASAAPEEQSAIPQAVYSQVQQPIATAQGASTTFQQPSTTTQTASEAPEKPTETLKSASVPEHQPSATPQTASASPETTSATLQSLSAPEQQPSAAPQTASAASEKPRETLQASPTPDQPIAAPQTASAAYEKPNETLQAASPLDLQPRAAPQTVSAVPEKPNETLQEESPLDLQPSGAPRGTPRGTSAPVQQPSATPQTLSAEPEEPSGTPQTASATDQQPSAAPQTASASLDKASAAPLAASAPVQQPSATPQTLSAAPEEPSGTPQTASATFQESKGSPPTSSTENGKPSTAKLAASAPEQEPSASPQTSSAATEEPSGTPQAASATFEQPSEPKQTSSAMTMEIDSISFHSKGKRGRKVVLESDSENESDIEVRRPKRSARARSAREEGTNRTDPLPKMSGRYRKVNAKQARPTTRKTEPRRTSARSRTKAKETIINLDDDEEEQQEQRTLSAEGLPQRKQQQLEQTLSVAAGKQGKQQQQKQTLFVSAGKRGKRQHEEQTLSADACMQEKEEQRQRTMSAGVVQQGKLGKRRPASAHSCVTHSEDDGEEKKTAVKKFKLEHRGGNKSPKIIETIDLDPEIREVSTRLDNNFVECLATVALGQIALPDRSNWFNESHMNYISTLMQNGYEHTRGLIVVYAPPIYFKYSGTESWLDKSKISDLSSRTDLDGVLQVVDGFYRATVLKKASRNTSVERIVVAVVQRANKCPISKDELVTFGIRKNALSAQMKKMTTAFNVITCNTIVRTLEREWNVSVREKPVLWLQKRIVTITNKDSSTVNSIRGYAVLAIACCGKPDVQEVIDRILRRTPQIGISHLTLSDGIASNVCAVELYLLSVRKSFLPSLCGPDQNDSKHLKDSSSMQGTRVKSFAIYKNEVFRDINKLCRIFETCEDLEENPISARDIIDTVVDTPFEVSDPMNGVLTKEYQYVLKDLLSDSISRWFCARTIDRVSELCLLCEDILVDDFPEIVSALQNAREDESKNFRPFNGPSTRSKSQNSHHKDGENDNSDDSSSHYSSDDRHESDNDDPEATSSQHQRESDLLKRLEKVRDAKKKLSQGSGKVQTESAPAQTLSIPAQTQNNNARTESAHAQTLSTPAQADSGRGQTEPAPVQNESAGAQTLSAPQQPLSASTQSESKPTRTLSVPSKTKSATGEDKSAPRPNDPDLIQDDSLDSENRSVYDERVPEKDPFGCIPPHRRNMEESRLNEDAKKSLALGFHRCFWNDVLPKDICMAAVLRALYLRPDHRASQWITHGNLSETHNAVHRQLCASFKRRNHCGLPSTESVHMQEGTLSLLESTQLRRELDEKGWCYITDCELVQEPMETMQSVYDAAPADVDGNAIWEIVRNNRDESMEELRRRGYGRRQNSRYAVMEFLENSSLVWKQRVKLDVIIGLLARAMRLGKRNGGLFDLFMPATGGRNLATDPGTDVQEAHCDVEVILLDHGYIPECPGYFAMVSGRRGFYLWISDRSHIFNQAGLYKSKPITLKKVFIPPFSVLFARGDLFHAGDKYDLSVGSDIRYHVLFTEKDREVGNAIQYARDCSLEWIDPLKTLN